MSPATGQRFARRRVTHNRNSLTVILPRPFLYAMQLRRGEVLELRLFVEEYGFRMRALRDVPREDIVAWPDLREDVCQRRLTRYGNGLSVAVPRHFWHALYVFQHDLLELLLADDRLSIWVQPVRPRRTRPAATADLVTEPEGPK